MGGNPWANNIDRSVDRLIDRINKLEKIVKQLDSQVAKLLNEKPNEISKTGNQA